MTAHHRIRRGVGGALGASLLGGALVIAPSPALADSLELISAENTEWQYVDTGIDPADGSDDLFAWAQPDFDDSEWATAVGPFGSMHGEFEDPMHGDFPVSTHLNQYYGEGEREGENIEAFFFRTTVDIDAAELEDVQAFIGNIHYDDAAKVFVNGEEIWGGRDDRFDPDAGTNMQYVGGNDVPPVSEEFTVDAEHFEVGENTIAVSLYNTNEGSSDIYLQFENLSGASEEDMEPEPEPAPADLDHLNGSGAVTDPYQINGANDLIAVAEAINTDAETYAAESYALTSDIDLTDVDFPLIDTFSGIFDGGGNTIHGLNVSEESADGSTRTAFFRQNSGVIQNMHLDGFNYSSEAVVDGSGPAVAALVAQNDGGIVQGNTLTDMVIEAPGMEKVAGLVAQTHGGRVEDNFVQGHVTARYMPAGAVSYANSQGQVNRNAVEADLVTVEPGGERGTNASMIATYPNGASVESNVVLGGSIDYTGTVEGHAGPIVGWMGFSDVLTLSDNLSAATVTVAGNQVDGARDDQNGEPTSAEDLAAQSTYEDLGWDFGTQWVWDAERGHPMPAGTGQAGPDGDGEPERVVLTAPEDPSTSQYVTWRTRSLERLEGTVEFRPAGTEETMTVAAEQKPERSVSGFPARSHSALLEGLSPSTEYEYRVGSESEWSQWYSFTTAAAEFDPYTFLYFGDAQNGIPTIYPHAVNAAVEAHPDAPLGLYAGDLIDHAQSEEQWGDWFETMSPLRTDRQVLATLGNHEIGGQPFIENFTDSFEYGANGPVPSDAGEYEDTHGEHLAEVLKDTAYFVDFQGVRYISINANHDDICPISRPEGQPDDCEVNRQAWFTAQANWLERTVEENPHEWTVALAHQPIFSVGVSSGGLRDEVMYREYVLPVLESTEVDLVLQGHDHTYGRGVHNDSATEFDGVSSGPVYVVSNAGEKMYDLPPDDDNRWTQNDANLQVRHQDVATYQAIHVEEDTLSFESVATWVAPRGEDGPVQVGDTVDSFTVTKDDEGNRWVTEEGVEAPAPGEPGEPDPTEEPTDEPTQDPTEDPSDPAEDPTDQPTDSPSSPEPTDEPTSPGEDEDEGDVVGTVTVTPAEVEPGGQVQVEADGFEAGEQVEITLNPTLSTLQADSQGAVETAVTIPADIEPGVYQLTVTGMDSQNSGSAPLTVLEPAEEPAGADGTGTGDADELTTPGGSSGSSADAAGQSTGKVKDDLAKTGASTAPLLIAASALLVLLGLALLIVLRRRHTAQAATSQI